MSADIQENIFEPLFTTKELGKGTGLGLATVYGVVKQNKGTIDVLSEGDKGTTFSIYLPMYQSEGSLEKRKETEQQTARGDETILIIEDEPTLLNMATRMLEHSGYKVHGATTPEQAINHAKRHKTDLKLIMTDVIMPEMNGRDLAITLQAIIPDCKCLYMSGYTADVIAHHGVLEEGVHFIQKPFSSRKLTLKVREISDKTTAS